MLRLAVDIGLLPCPSCGELVGYHSDAALQAHRVEEIFGAVLDLAFPKSYWQIFPR